MAFYTISGSNRNLIGEIALPSSKSISNRLLLLCALTGGDTRIKNLSAAEDTCLFQELLEQIETVNRASFNPEISPATLYCGNAGTVLRFLTSYLAHKPGTWILHGSERMEKRPVAILVEALRSLGASISYLGTPGYPPIRITGQALKGGKVSVDSSVSSQYVSSLLMIAPTLTEGLTVRLTGEKVSSPYVEMTVSLMREFGAHIDLKGDSVIVRPGNYQPGKVDGRSFSVESDWSSASFWYEAAALADSAEIRLPGLWNNSLQGDSVLADFFSSLGVKTRFYPEGITLKKEQGPGHWAQRTGHSGQGTGNKEQGRTDGSQSDVNTFQSPTLDPRTSSLSSRPLSFDLSAYPDLAPALIVSYAALGLPARFSGLHHLAIKESDRIQALDREIERIGRRILLPADGIIETIAGKPIHSNFRDNGIDPDPVLVETYNDHRIAMAFAPLSLKTGAIRINNPSVVSKSYPGFWEEMEKVGFSINEQE